MKTFINYYKQFSAFIGGKKTTIATILGAIITFCVGRDYIQPDVANLISIILVALGLSINIADIRLKK